jgi:hypothetical protein
MNTVQIESALGQDPAVSPHFLGVFPCDKLPQPTKYPCAVVANTDPAGAKGEHWVAFYIADDGTVEYFDSFGMPPLNCDLFSYFESSGKKYKFNDVQLQGISSTACGHYCIAFLARRVRGQSLDDIVHKFFKGGKTPGQNDKRIEQLVTDTYSIKPTPSSLDLHGKGTIQCCCPLKCSKRLCECIKQTSKCLHS